MVKAEVVICVIPELGPAVPPRTHSLGLGFAFGSPLRRGQEETRRRVVFLFNPVSCALEVEGPALPSLTSATTSDDCIVLPQDRVTRADVHHPPALVGPRNSLSLQAGPL